MIVDVVNYSSETERMSGSAGQTFIKPTEMYQCRKMINESVRQSSIHLNKKLPPGPGRLQDVDPSGPPAMLEVQTQEVPSGNFNKVCLKQLSKQLLAQNPSESLSYWTILQRTVYIQCQSRKWVELPAERRTVKSWRSMDV